MDHGQKTENETIDALLESIKHEDGQDGVTPTELPTISVRPSEESEMHGEGSASNPLRGEVLRNVKLKVKVELGRTRMALHKALSLAPGSVVELGKDSGDFVEILVNSIPIARGQIMVVDNRFCVRIAEIITTPDMGITS